MNDILNEICYRCQPFFGSNASEKDYENEFVNCLGRLGWLQWKQEINTQDGVSRWLTMEDESYFKRILPVVVDDTIRDSQFYLDLVKYWKDQKDEKETFVAELKKIDVDVAVPEEEKLRKLEAVFNLLPAIKIYIDWTDVENLDSMSATRFNTIVRKIKERRESV